MSDLNQTQSEIDRLKQEVEANEAKVRELQQRQAFDQEQKKKKTEEDYINRIVEHRERFEYLFNLTGDKEKEKAVRGGYILPGSEPVNDGIMIQQQRASSLVGGGYDGQQEDMDILLIIDALHEQYMKKFEELEKKMSN